MEDAELDEKRDKLLAYLDHADRVTHSESKKQLEFSKPVSRTMSEKTDAPKVLAVLLPKYTVTTSDNSKLILPTIMAAQVAPVQDEKIILEQAKQERLNIESLSNKRELIEQELCKAEEQATANEQTDKKDLVNKGLSKASDQCTREKIDSKVAKHLKEQTRLEAKRLRANSILQVKLERQKKNAEIRARLVADWHDFKNKYFSPKTLVNLSDKKGKIVGVKKINLPARFDFLKIARQWVFGGLSLIFGFYFFYLFVVYTFAPSYINEIGFNDYLPAPAMISSEGLIDYYDYFDHYSKSGALLLGEDFNVGILRSRIIKRWALRYNLDPSIDQETLVQALQRRVLEDVSINNSSSERYLSLRVAMRTSASLAEVSRKTNLKISTKLVTERLAKSEFGSKIEFIYYEHMSQILFTKDGVVVLTRESLPENRLQLDYVYIPATTFDELLAEEMSNAWIVSLVE